MSKTTTSALQEFAFSTKHNHIPLATALNNCIQDVKCGRKISSFLANTACIHRANTQGGTDTSTEKHK